jgi:hypothetical protein
MQRAPTQIAAQPEAAADMMELGTMALNGMSLGSGPAAEDSREVHSIKAKKTDFRRRTHYQVQWIDSSQWTTWESESYICSIAPDAVRQFEDAIRRDTAGQCARK